MAASCLPISTRPRPLGLFSTRRSRRGGNDRVELESDSMRQYLELMRDVRDHGAVKSDRTGTGTKSLFGRQMRFDLSRSFPLITTKR